MKTIWYKLGLMSIIAISSAYKLPAQQLDIFTDPRDGSEYKIVQIGEQRWLAENLAFNAHTTSSVEYDPSHVEKFGRLYVWEEAVDACPTGWHLPGTEEFETLLKNTGGDDSKSYSGLISGGSSDFDALLGGWRNNGGADGNFGNYAYFWSSSTDRPGRIWTLNLYGYSRKASMYNSFTENAYSNSHGEYVGFCIRCIKDN